MNSNIFRYDARRLLPFWILSVLGLGYYYVVAAAPLHSASMLSSNSFPIVLGAILFGMMVGGRLIADTGATHAFVLSRGLTRRQLFVHRLVLGVLVVLSTSVLLWFLLASSLRSHVHQWLQFEDAAFYPMVAQFEPHAAFAFFKLASFSMLLVVCLQTLRSIRNADQTTTASGQLKFWLAELPLMLLCTVPIISFSHASDESFLLRDMIWSWAPPIVCLLAVSAAFYASRYTEVGS